MNFHPKVVAGASGLTVGTAVTTIGVWVASLYGITVPADVALAIGFLVNLALGGSAAYLTPSPKGP